MSVSKHGLAILIALSACGKVNDAVRTIKGENQKKVEADFSAADANGTWKIECGVTTLVQGSYRISSTLVIADGKATRDATYYSDECKTEVYATHQTATFVVGGSLDETHRSLSTTNITATATPKTKGMADALNAISIWGHTDWAVGQSTDIGSAAPSLSESNVLKLDSIQIITGTNPVLSLMQHDGGSYILVPANQYSR